MFGFFSNLLTARRNRKRQQVRAIFHYWDGRDEIGSDPMELLQRVARHPKFRPEKHYELVVRPPKIPDTVDEALRKAMKDEWDEAYQITIQAIREVFGLPVFRELNGQRVGLTNDELLGLFGTLCQYVTDEKKNGSPGPIAPSNSVATPQSQSNYAAPTNANSDSGSIVDGPALAVPLAS